MDLTCMQISCQNAVSAGFGNKVRDKLGRNRRSSACFTVLAGIAKIRNNRGNALR